MVDVEQTRGEKRRGEVEEKKKQKKQKVGSGGKTIACQKPFDLHAALSFYS